MQEGYADYMKMVTDNFVRMQSVEKPTKQALGYEPSDDTIWALSWKPEDGLRWGVGNFEVFINHDANYVKSFNNNLALAYLRHNTKTHEEYLEFIKN